MFEKGSDFKRDFAPLLKDFNIKHVLITTKIPHANAPVGRLYQVILNMLDTNIFIKIFDYIYLWGETLAYIAWEIRDYYHHTFQATPGQYVFFRDMIFNFVSVVDWRVITSGRQQLAHIGLELYQL